MADFLLKSRKVDDMTLKEFDDTYREKYEVVCGCDEAGRGPLAGDVFAAAVVFDKDTVYEWFVCGKDGCYPKVYPSTLATWAAIRFAADNGYKRFDMMGAGAPGDGGYGVREFKAKFGGELVEYGRYLHVCNKLLYGLGKFAVNIMKKL